MTVLEDSKLEYSDGRLPGDNSSLYKSYNISEYSLHAKGL